MTTEPPMTPNRSANTVSTGVIDQRGKHPRHDQKPHRLQPHGFERVDLLAHFHGADLGGEGRTRAAGENDRRHQRPHLAQHRQADHIGDKNLRAELTQGRPPPETP